MKDKIINWLEKEIKATEVEIRVLNNNPPAHSEAKMQKHQQEIVRSQGKIQAYEEVLGFIERI